jgi:release factor glutamine methyltransferase
MPTGALIPDGMVQRLRAAGCVFAEAEARLLAEAAGTAGELEAMLEQRISGLPLEPILGWVEFCGRRLAVGPGVFIPRRRTEFLARQAIAFAAERPAAASGRTPVASGRAAAAAVVVELCCGVAAVAATVAAELVGTELYAADIDPVATVYARRNLGPAGSVFEGDLYAALPRHLRGRVRVLAANAPYVPTAEIALMPPEARLHEAMAALDGGADGLDVQRRIAAEAPGWLAPGGCLLVETGKRQSPVTAAIFAESGLTPRILSSSALDATVVVGLL